MKCDNCIHQRSLYKSDCIDCIYWEKERKSMIEACGTRILNADYDDLKINKTLYLPVKVKSYTVSEHGVTVELTDNYGPIGPVDLCELMAPMRKGDPRC